MNKKVLAVVGVLAFLVMVGSAEAQSRRSSRAYGKRSVAAKSVRQQPQVGTTRTATQIAALNTRIVTLETRVAELSSRVDAAEKRQQALESAAEKATGFSLPMPVWVLLAVLLMAVAIGALIYKNPPRKATNREADLVEQPAEADTGFSEQSLDRGVGDQGDAILNLR